MSIQSNIDDPIIEAHNKMLARAGIGGASVHEHSSQELLHADRITVIENKDGSTTREKELDIEGRTEYYNTSASTALKFYEGFLNKALPRRPAIEDQHKVTYERIIDEKNHTVNYVPKGVKLIGFGSGMKKVHEDFSVLQQSNKRQSRKEYSGIATAQGLGGSIVPDATNINKKIQES